MFPCLFKNIIVYILQPFYFSVKFVSNFRYSFPISWTATVKKSIPLKKFLIFFSMSEGTVNPYFGCKACTFKNNWFSRKFNFLLRMFSLFVYLLLQSAVQQFPFIGKNNSRKTKVHIWQRWKKSFWRSAPPNFSNSLKYHEFLDRLPC